MRRKRGLVLLMIGVVMCSMLTGCTEAEKVSRNLAQESDNFNVIRTVTVINCIT